MANLNIQMSEEDLAQLPKSLRDKYLNEMAEQIAEPQRSTRQGKAKYAGVKPVTAVFAAKTRPAASIAKPVQMASDAITVGKYTAQLVDLGPKYGNAKRIDIAGMPFRAKSFKPGQMRALFSNPEALEAMQLYLQHLEDAGYFGTDTE